MFGNKPIVGEKVVSLLKNRITLPAFTGAEVGEPICVQYDWHKTRLRLFKESEYERRLKTFEEKLKELRNEGKITYDQYMWGQRYYFGCLSFMPEELDGQKRLHLEPRVFEDLGLDKTGFVVGVKNHLELYPSFETYSNTLQEVYRICSYEEATEILSNQEFIGRQFEQCNANSHQYETGKEYTHFFNRKRDVVNFSSGIGQYLLTCRIPKELLDKYYGEGYYLNIYDIHRKVPIEEFAVPTEELTFTYLERVEKITSFIPSEDVESDPTLSSYLEPFYIKEPIKKLTK